MPRQLITGPFRIRDMRYDGGRVYARHAHDEVQVSVIVRGALREDAAGRMNRVSAGDVLVKPAGTMHADEYDETRIVCIDFAPDVLELPVGGYAWHRVDPAAAAGFRVARRFLGGGDVGEEIDELLAALPRKPLRDRAAATRAAAMLDDCFTAPLRIGAIAAELRLHPVYLTRIFSEQWGCTPREYLQRLRARAAVHRITSTARELAAIASETGFSDQSHMTRVIAKTTGLTPAALRRIARG
ncbi:MAG TPA: AraC family transcriptional regulator [Thermoanaerobaculia bacterium]